MKKKSNFFYNPTTLQFEKKETPVYQKLYNALGYISVSLVCGVIIFFVFGSYFESIKTKYYKQRFNQLDGKYNQLSDLAVQLKKEMSVLEKRDNDIYRAIFQAKNIEDSLRAVDEHSITKYDHAIYGASVKELYEDVETSLYQLKNRIKFQLKSYAMIDELIKNKENLIRATPAIQPIANKDLNRIASGFGYRIDPVYKTEKFHEGLDFTAPAGTAIYATADGVIEKMEFNGGYGNHVIINHGFGYKTLYGHLFKYEVHVGKKIKRGEVVGYVGNTGKSTGPHCHYEVIKDGVKINPIYYFFNDLSAQQFQQITTIANQRNQSLD